MLRVRGVAVFIVTLFGKLFGNDMISVCVWQFIVNDWLPIIGEEHSNITGLFVNRSRE